MGEKRLAPFHINQEDGNITEADGVAATWSDIWKYQVPQGSEIVLQAGDFLSCYLEDTSPAEVGDDDCYVKLEVRDPSEQDVRSVFGAALYMRVGEFADKNTKARLVLAAPLTVIARQWIVLAAKDGVAIDASDSHFDLTTSKVATPLS